MEELLRVEDVSRICNISKDSAYKLMQKINLELSEKGYIIIRGRVNGKYLLERMGIKSKEA